MDKFTQSWNLELMTKVTVLETWKKFQKKKHRNKQLGLPNISGTDVYMFLVGKNNENFVS